MERIKKETVINLIVFILFAVLTFIVGIHHEPWADEAQAWLIARENTYLHLITDALKYDGHPLIWYYLLRTLYLLHFPYRLIFLVPWLCSVVGIWLFLFRSKIPIFIKIFFPFTYFIFFQYAVVARNHSLIFPMLAIIAVFYGKRLHKPYIYAFLLILLTNISAQGFVLAFALLLFFIFDLYKEKIKNIGAPALIFTGLILTAIYMIKPADCTFGADIHIRGITKIFYIITKGYFNILAPVKYLECAVVLAFYVIAGRIFCKNIYQISLFSILNFSIVSVLSILYCNNWHAGYLILTFIFSCWLLSDMNNIQNLPFKKNILFYVLAAFLFSVQILWSIKCAFFDIKNDYCASRKVAEFIKQNNLDEKVIYGLGFKTVAIQPYFEKSIFKNYKRYTYWGWKAGSQMNDEEIVSSPPDVIIFDFFMNKNYPDSYKLALKNYELNYFGASMYTKGKFMENNSFVVFVKKY